MNACWCAPSGGGCSGGRVTGMVIIGTHDVRLGHSRLMAGFAQQACEAVVANDLVLVCPALSDLVPNRFGVVPVGGADTGFHH
jgi:hypothetical protein